MHIIVNNSKFIRYQFIKNAFFGNFFMFVFLFMISLKFVFFISEITSGEKTFSYQNLSPSLMFLNCSPTIVAPNYPNTAFASIDSSPIMPTHKSTSSIEW